jgi:hypothetical protein
MGHADKVVDTLDNHSGQHRVNAVTRKQPMAPDRIRLNGAASRAPATAREPGRIHS